MANQPTRLAVAVIRFIVGVLIGILPMAAMPARANDGVRVVLIPVVDTLPMFVAVDQGFFAHHGVDVSIISVANQGIVMSALVSGSAEIANEVASTMLQGREAGIDSVILWDAASFPYPQPLHVGIVARTGSGIAAARDLVGRKVAVVGINGFHHTLVKRWLEEKRVDPARINFVEVPFPQMMDVLRAGTVDAAVSIDPFYNRILANNVGFVFDNFVATVPDGALIDFYATQRGWAAAHGDIIARMRAGLADAIAFIKSNDAGARESLASSSKQPPEVVAHTTLPDYKIDVRAEQVEFWIELAKHQGLITEPYEAASFVYRP
jgi:NitT/TauT family transport system substrate-binding protein